MAELRRRHRSALQMLGADVVQLLGILFLATLTALHVFGVMIAVMYVIQDTGFGYCIAIFSAVYFGLVAYSLFVVWLFKWLV